jgi:CMP-N,N'-diacetyllegionaminic acid synthase
MISFKKKKKKILALVLARKNSRRLKNKNIIMLKNKPLINITLDNLIKIKFLFENILVSSDSKIIENYTKKRKLIFLKRPKELSLDNTSSERAAIDAIKKYEKKYTKIDYIILFQPTSPYRKNSTVKKIIQLSKKYPKKQIVTVNFSNQKKPNGILYLTPKDILFSKKSFSYKNYIKFVVKSKKESLDIDTLKDYIIAKKISKHES